MQRLTFSAALEEIGDYAFASCTYLLSANMGSTRLKRIGEYAFSECKSLDTVKAPSTLVYVGPCAFEATSWVDNSISTGIMYIGSVALKYNGTMVFNSQKRLSVKSGTAMVAGEAFWWNPDIISFTACSSLDYIGERAFTGCTAMETVTLNDGLKGIGADAFRECSALKSLTVPASVTEIGERAFGLTYDEETFTFVPDSEFTVYCAFMSAAHIYARDNGIRYVLSDMPAPGDVDGDGDITTDDARTALRYAAGLIELNDIQKFSADIDGNGTVTTAEARRILRASTGLEAL